MFKYLVVLAIFASVAYGQAGNCTDYCTSFLANCDSTSWPGNSGYYYADMASCMKVCTAFPLGTVGDTSHNTVACRTYHAGAASGNATLHCPHASATGGNACGTYCEAYCNLTLTACTAATGYDTPMGSVALSNYAACSVICPAFTEGAILTDQSQDTLACRMYHAKVAMNSPNPHCPHASPSGDGVCGSFCEAYCDVVTANCVGSLAQYASKSACLAYCQNNSLATGAWNDTSGDSSGCRIYHADAAAVLAQQSTHCPHAGPSGANTCGLWCDVYCDLIQHACTGNNQQFSSVSACQTACAGYSTAGTPGATSGNTVQCRIYHAGVAGTNIAQNAALHCPHAGPSGGGVCVSTTTGATGGSTTKGSGAATIAVSAFLLVAMILVALF